MGTQELAVIIASVENTLISMKFDGRRRWLFVVVASTATMGWVINRDDYNNNEPTMVPVHITP